VCERANCLVGVLGDRASLPGRYDRSGKPLAQAGVAPAAAARARVDALREAIAAVGGAGGSGVALAFAGNAFAADRQEGRTEPADIEGSFAFQALAGWDAMLARAHRTAGDRFGEILYAARDKGGLSAWSGTRAAEASEAQSLARRPAGVGALESFVGGQTESAQSETRTIVYLNKGKASVMVVRNPAAKK
jgi:hypothetical protein